MIRALADRIMRRPRSLEEVGLTPCLIRRIAVHEAGHAVANVATGRLRLVRFVSIDVVRGVPRCLVKKHRDPSEEWAETFTDRIGLIMVKLAGRAAEEIAYGQNLSMGCRVDLQHATAMALELVAELGFSPSVGLVSSGGPGALEHPEVRSSVSAVLEGCYSETLKMLRRHGSFVDTLAAELVETRHVTVDRLSSMALRAGLASAS